MKGQLIINGDAKLSKKPQIILYFTRGEEYSSLEWDIDFSHYKFFTFKSLSGPKMEITIPRNRLIKGIQIR